MARQAPRPAIVSDNVDRFLGHVLGACAGVMFTFLVLIELWRRFGPK